MSLRLRSDAMPDAVFPSLVTQRFLLPSLVNSNGQGFLVHST
jgi:hypothetical protein